jgi:hypothetical protein
MALKHSILPNKTCYGKIVILGSGHLHYKSSLWDWFLVILFHFNANSNFYRYTNDLVFPWRKDLFMNYKIRIICHLLLKNICSYSCTDLTSNLPHWHPVLPNWNWSHICNYSLDISTCIFSPFKNPSLLNFCFSKLCLLLYQFLLVAPLISSLTKLEIWRFIPSLFFFSDSLTCLILSGRSW